MKEKNVLLISPDWMGLHEDIVSSLESTYFFISD